MLGSAVFKMYAPGPIIRTFILQTAVLPKQILKTSCNKEYILFYGSNGNYRFVFRLSTAAVIQPVGLLVQQCHQY